MGDGVISEWILQEFQSLWKLANIELMTKRTKISPFCEETFLKTNSALKRTFQTKKVRISA